MYNTPNFFAGPKILTFSYTGVWPFIKIFYHQMKKHQMLLFNHLASVSRLRNAFFEVLALIPHIINSFIPAWTADVKEAGVWTTLLPGKVNTFEKISSKKCHLPWGNQHDHHFLKWDMIISHRNLQSNRTQKRLF